MGVWLEELVVVSESVKQPAIIAELFAWFCVCEATEVSWVLGANVITRIQRKGWVSP